MIVVTVAERKAAKVAALKAGLAELRAELSARARELGGAYLLYGSAARGELRHDSDIDLLLDFPDDDADRRAWDAAEAACSRLKLPHDIRPVRWCSERFLQHVLPGAERWV